MVRAMMDHQSYSDSYLRTILRETRVIAMVGASPHWNRPSYFAMKYLQAKGYRVIPVNPAVAGQEILGERVYATLADIPDTVDMVDIFRNSEAAGPIVDAAIAKGAVVMDRCPKIEFGRLSGALSWGGINSGVISSRRRRPLR